MELKDSSHISVTHRGGHSRMSVHSIGRNSPRTQARRQYEAVAGQRTTQEEDEWSWTVAEAGLDSFGHWRLVKKGVGLEAGMMLDPADPRTGRSQRFFLLKGLKKWLLSSRCLWNSYRNPQSRISVS